MRALTEHRLVDEYRLMVFPIILGSGKRLFGDATQAVSLRLAESMPVGADGVVILVYEPAGERAPDEAPLGFDEMRRRTKDPSA